MKYNNVLTKEFLTEEYCNKKRSPQSIAKELSCCPHTVYNALKRVGISQEIRDNRIYPGDKFNSLTAIEITGTTKNKNYIWKCLCVCGNTTQARTSQIKNGSVKSCGCAIKKGKENKKWTGHEEISGSFWSGVKFAAKLRKINFDLSIEDIWCLYLKQNKKCYLSGVNIDFTMHKETASIDRIDSKKSYIIDNVALCHKDINKIKASFSVDEFRYYCELICNFNGKFEKTETNINLYRGYWKDLEYGANRRKIDFSISIMDIELVYNKQGEKCALTGIELSVPRNLKEYRSRKHTFSVDRIDNNLGYTLENIQIVHKLINQSRKNLTIEYYKELCQKVQKLKTV